MSLKSDRWIKSMSESENMIVPFFDKSIKLAPDGRKIPSYGLSSYGYDVRLGRNFTFFKGYGKSELTNRFEGNLAVDSNSTSFSVIETSRGERVFKDYNKTLDICDFDMSCGEVFEDEDWVIMPPHSFLLGHTEEKIKVPRDVSVVCMGKSTIARAGIIVTVTPLEAGWEGFVTLEITNTTNIPIKLWSGIGITQLLFYQGDEQCMVSYADRGGKYQNQAQVPVMPSN